MRKILYFLSIFLYFPYLVTGQGQKQVSITTGISVEKDIDVPLSGAKATLYEKGKEIASVVTKSDGIVTFTLQPNSEYIIEISKDNYVSKRVSINTKIPEYENQQFEIAFSVLLFVPCEGLDYSMLQSPVLKVVYNDVKRDFLPDKLYDQIMQSKLEQLMKKNQECIDAKFKDLVNKADRLFREKRYAEARPVYVEASQLKPNDKYVQEQIAEIDRLLAKQKDDSKKYAEIIAQADKYFDNQRYPMAREWYKRALVVRPDESYPVRQIARIDSLLKKETEAKNAQQTQEQAFNDLIAQGDDAFFDDVCGKALPAYKKALEIKPNDPVAQKKYKEAEQECNKKQAQLALQQETRAKYQQAIRQADSLYNLKQYDKAIAAYQLAQNILPNEKYPKSKIDEINRELEKQAKATDSQYKNLIRQADKAFDIEDYAAAKSAYQQALAIKPNDSYAKSRISDIDKIVAEIQKQEAERKANQQKYQTLITQADQAMKNAQYDKASNLYQQALALIPSEKYPKDKLKEIDQILADQALQSEKNYKAKIESGDKNFVAKNYSAALADYSAALQIKPGETYPTQQIELINKIVAEQQKAEAEQKAREENYRKAIARADQLFNSQQYDDAIVAYREAANYKPEEKYPLNKIEEINQIKQQKEREASYKKAIQIADAAFGKKNYQEAKFYYQQALAIVPNDRYATEQLQKTEKAISEELKALADQKARQEAYDKAIADGDKSFAMKNYEEAKISYQSAQAIFPDKPYPAQRVAEIDRILKEIAVQKNYDNLIAEADNLFQLKSYEQARSKYQSAQNLKPAENYPKQKIKEIDDILARMAAEQKQREELQKRYQTVIARADQLFNQGNYDQAAKEYENALTILPDENYPKQRLSKIKEIKNLLAQESKKPAAQPKPAEKETVLPDLKFNTKEEREKYLKELMVKYPAGITCEIYKEKYRKITRYIVIRENEANDYRMIEYKWGVEYFRNDKPITELYFRSQIKAREGEYFVTVEM
ncbi:MAG: hypothetical protein ACP5PZ_10115 [Bacteroidales bacterium]